VRACGRSIDHRETFKHYLIRVHLPGSTPGAYYSPVIAVDSIVRDSIVNAADLLNMPSGISSGFEKSLAFPSSADEQSVRTWDLSDFDQWNLRLNSSNF